MPAHIAMITIFVRDCNRFAQSFYNSVVSSLQLHQLSCSCGHASCLHVHGYYTRGIKLPAGLAQIRILRLRCCICGTTHAVLLSSMVTYSQISAEDQRQICIAYEQGLCPSDICDRNPSIDENNVKSVRRNYRLRWREMLRSIAVGLQPALELILRCFSNYSSQFLQIRRGTNQLFSLTT